MDSKSQNLTSQVEKDILKEDASKTIHELMETLRMKESNNINDMSKENLFFLGKWLFCVIYIADYHGDETANHSICDYFSGGSLTEYLLAPSWHNQNVHLLLFREQNNLFSFSLPYASCLTSSFLFHGTSFVHYSFLSAHLSACPSVKLLDTWVNFLPISYLL